MTIILPIQRVGLHHKPSNKKITSRGCAANRFLCQVVMRKNMAKYSSQMSATSKFLQTRYFCKHSVGARRREGRDLKFPARFAGILWWPFWKFTTSYQNWLCFQYRHRTAIIPKYKIFFSSISVISSASLFGFKISRIDNI